MTQDQTWDLDAVAARLAALRREAGAPSYAEIARRVQELRVSRGVPAHATHVARSTVYDVFRPGRRRLDIGLLREILLVLGTPEAGVGAWVARVRVAEGSLAWSDVVDAHLDPASPPEVFVGRDRELAAALGALSAGACVVLDGMPGVGKSALARRVARTRAASTGRVLHVDVRGFRADRRPPRPSAVLTACWRALGRPPHLLAGEAVDAADAVAEELARQDVVVVLDDVPTADHLDALTRAAPGRVVATSRVALDLVGAVRLTLEPLDAEESVRLLRDLVGPGRVDAEPEATQRVASTVGGLPLALELTASRMASHHWSIADHATALTRRRDGRRLDEPIRDALRLSYDALPHAVRTSLRHLAAQPAAALDVTEIAALTDLPVPVAAEHVDVLAARHLVTRGGGLVGLHDLVRAFAADASEEEDPPSERTAALHRLRELWVTRSWAAHQAIRHEAGSARSRRRDVAAADDVEVARTWLSRAADAAVLVTDPETEPDPEHVVELSEALTWSLNAHGRWDVARTLHERAIAAADEMDDLHGALVARLALGQVSVRLADWDRAERLLTVALDGLERLGDADRVRAALNALAVMTVHTGRTEEGASMFERVIELARAEGGLDAVVATARDNLAVAYRRLGRVSEAAGLHREAAEEAHRRGSLDDEAAAWTNLSDVLLLQGDAEQSLEIARRALDLAERASNGRVMAYAQANAGNALAALGHPAEGAAHHRRALELNDRIGDRHLEVSALNDLGRALLASGDVDGAEHVLDRALVLAGTLGDDMERGRSLDGLGGCRLARGDDAAAGERWREALLVFEKLGSPEAAAARERLDSLARNAADTAP